jgi:hypothetical protein
MRNIPVPHLTGNLRLPKFIPDDKSRRVRAQQHTPFTGDAGQAGRGNPPKTCGEEQQKTPAERHAAMTPDQVRGRFWAQCLKRVFNIDMQTCSACGGAVKVIACIEDSAVIEKILAHLNEKALPVQAPPLPKCRAPPQSVLFD